MSADEPETAAPAKKPLWRRFAPLAVLLAGLALVYLMGWHERLNLQTLRENQVALEAWVAANLLLAVLAYMVFYALAVSISVPGALWFTIGAGFLFGVWIGTGVAVIGATIGATIIFLAARYAFADWVRQRFGRQVRRLQDGFSENAFTYVMILRLIPVMPFFGINIATALLNVPLRAYFLGTLFGVIPGAYIYATVGAKLGELAAAGEVPGLAQLIDAEIVVALVAFAGLAVLPWFYKRITGHRPAEPDADEEEAETN
ncbi:hypothetical protein DDZ18_04225 [Marinicauda salina]|uniref:TVP38/TMEM64 family membrane protein n=1 Tax=Marinicauda salina TaxID=2135793 RepID=A0A2U2BXR5_9PROT|nr:TVP38/TMEM64 family protein [Marinicauda salina]PWE18805.1 hypothetical protein DDZ18_04225 [Marinicauda salina]